MDKWQKYGGYENWKCSEDGWLKVKYDEYMEKNYTSTMPDTYVSFDDFCMGQWQGLDGMLANQ